MVSQRESLTMHLLTGQAMMTFTKHSEDDAGLPHATKKTMADHLREALRVPLRSEYPRKLHARGPCRFNSTPQRMRIIVEAFKESLEVGLLKHGQVMPMISTYVFGWPTGKETGTYLAAVDLGGTNLHKAGASSRSPGEPSPIGGAEAGGWPEALRLLHQEEGLIPEGQVLLLGFTFPYPCSELSVPADVVALTCDTTGTLIASRDVNPKTPIACIFGTGCNAAHMERVSDIPKIAELGIDSNMEMAINCDAFDSFEHENLPRTEHNQIIDETSNNPGEQAFEKLISGRYLGEILRLIICEPIDESVLFLGLNTHKIEIPYSFNTAFLSLMEMNLTDKLLMIIGIFNHFFALETTLDSRQFFHALARLVGRRAARLSACRIAAIVSKMGYLDEGCSVGADGSLYNKHPDVPGSAMPHAHQTPLGGVADSPASLLVI
ncbi:hypothetical protein C8Q76DRAFT_694906 [Earliella scabrosa]|nr:hypothetical protein C8Q76DRAFT_694906 [Earliella scabrosa]